MAFGKQFETIVFCVLEFLMVTFAFVSQERTAVLRNDADYSEMRVKAFNFLIKIQQIGKHITGKLLSCELE